jgi:hypothetical protein
MRVGKLVLAFGALALLAVPALAQPGRGFGRGMGAAGLLQNKSVQEELKLEKDQVTKIDDALKKVRDDHKDDLDKLRDPGTSQEDRAAILKKVSEANEKALKGILNEKQETRLHQILHQQQGVAMFVDEAVQKKLNLTAEQKDKLKTINEDMTKDIRELFSGGKPGPDTITKIQGIRKEAMTNAQKVLDDKQKKEVKEMLGEPFEIKFEGRGGKPGGDKPPARTDF